MTMLKLDSLLTGFLINLKLKTPIVFQTHKSKMSCMNAPRSSNSGLQGIPKLKLNTGEIFGLVLLDAD